MNKALVEKVTKAEETVAKRKATIERHEKALEKKIQVLVKAGFSREQIETEIDRVKWPVFGEGAGKYYWEAIEVEQKKDDIKGATKKLAEAERILEGHRERLQKDLDKDDFVKNNAPKAIVDFLEKWKEMSYNWHVKRYEGAVELKKELIQKTAEAMLEAQELEIIYHRDVAKFLEERKLDSKSVRALVNNKAGSAVVLNMMTMKDESERLAYLNRLLEADKRAKLIDLVQRVNDVVGEINDASKLEVNAKGNLDGYVYGNKGGAQVETIGAGGYNIVCFHYRTLIKPMK